MKWATARGFSVLAATAKGVFSFLSDLDLPWAQELCIYMFIWMAKFGAAYGVRTGIHVGVDLLVNRLPDHSRKKVILFSLLCGALFTGMIAAFGASFVGEMFKTGQQSNDLEAPMWFVYLAIPLGSGLMCFRFLQVAWSFYRTGELPKHDVSHVEGVDTADAGAAGDDLHPQPAAVVRDDKPMSPTLRIMSFLPPALVIVPFVALAVGIK